MIIVTISLYGPLIPLIITVTLQGMKLTICIDTFEYEWKFVLIASKTILPTFQN